MRPGWVPVLGRTAAGIVHFWDKSKLPRPEQAVTQLDELVKKYVGKSIVASSGGRVSVDLQVKPVLRGLKRREANLVQISSDESNGVVEFVECEELFQLYPDSFGLRIDGDSMSPRIKDGDVLIASPSVGASQGQIAIVKLVGQIGVTCKLIRITEEGVHLIPINESYRPTVVAQKELLWSLAVLCHVSV